MLFILKFVFYIIIFIGGIIIGSFLNNCISYFLQEKIMINQSFSWDIYIEVINGILYVVTFFVKGMNFMNIIYCFMESALIIVAIIDWYTYEIPFSINMFLGVLGVIMSVLDREYFISHFIGLIFVSGVLSILYYITDGTAIGGGDIKLMAGCGLIIGWKNIGLAFFIGCVVGTIVHIIRMRISNVGNMFAMGPYLAIGIFLTTLWS